MRMLRTFKHVGTYTPENIPNFLTPPTGRGPSPRFVAEEAPLVFLPSVASSLVIIDSLLPLMDLLVSWDNPSWSPFEYRRRRRSVRECSCVGVPFVVWSCELLLSVAPIEGRGWSSSENCRAKSEGIPGSLAQGIPGPRI